MAVVGVVGIAFLATSLRLVRAGCRGGGVTYTGGASYGVSGVGQRHGHWFQHHQQHQQQMMMLYEQQRRRDDEEQHFHAQQQQQQQQ